MAVPVDGSPLLTFSNLQDCPQEDGGLFFMVKIGLTKPTGVFSIRYLHKQIAVKYKDNTALFSTADPENINNGTWSSDKAKISNEIVELLAKHLSYDPFTGPQPKNVIGFGFRSEINQMITNRSTRTR